MSKQNHLNKRQYQTGWKIPGNKGSFTCIQNW